MHFFSPLWFQGSKIGWSSVDSHETKAHGRLVHPFLESFLKTDPTFNVKEKHFVSVNTTSTCQVVSRFLVGRHPNQTYKKREKPSKGI